MKAIYIAVENGVRTDFYTTSTEGWDNPLVLTYVARAVRDHGLSFTEAMENLSEKGVYVPGLPVKDRMFEKLTPENAVELNKGFMADHLISQRIIYDFDNRKLSQEHDPAACFLPIRDGVWEMPDIVFRPNNPKTENTPEQEGGPRMDL